MVTRILAAGHDVVVHARRPEAHGALQTAGAAITTSIREAAAGVDVLGVNVFDDAQLHQVMFDEGVLGHCAPGTVVVVHSTGDPGLVEALASSAPTGVRVVDATFSGTALDVAKGRLTLICGCDEEALAAARPVLDAYASRIFHVGSVGAGRKLKLLNNMLFAAQVSLANETLDAALAMGLHKADIVAAIGASSGASYAFDKFNSSAAPAEILAGLKPYLDKDVHTARACLALLGRDTPLLDHAARWGLNRKSDT